MGKEKNKGVYFTLPENQINVIKYYARELYMTQSSFIRYCIDKEIERLDREYGREEC